jgi:hypothetical protein
MCELAFSFVRKRVGTESLVTIKGIALNNNLYPGTTIWKIKCRVKKYITRYKEEPIMFSFKEN